MLSPALALFFDSYLSYLLSNWVCQSSVHIPVCPAQTQKSENISKICILLLITRYVGKKMQPRCDNILTSVSLFPRKKFKNLQKLTEEIMSEYLG